MATPRRGPKEFLTYLAARAVIGLALALPYRVRVRFIGQVVDKVVAPLAGWRRRIRNNLALIYPDLPDGEVQRLVHQVSNNVGRSLIEGFSRTALIEQSLLHPLQGPGLAALEEAKRFGQRMVLVTAHFGNHNVPRAALIAKGYEIGAIYMPMSNGFFNDYYVAELKTLGEPLFERSRKGLAQMVKFLRGGRMVGMVVDHHMAHGEPLDFLGHPAYTALSAAEMALKYDALLVPIYGRRRADGFEFDVIVDAPIQPSTPIEMTKAMHASLERLIAETPEQWFWIHRRWKAPKSNA